MSFPPSPLANVKLVNRIIQLGNGETNNSIPSNPWAIIKRGPIQEVRIQSSLKESEIRVTHIMSEVL